MQTLSGAARSGSHGLPLQAHPLKHDTYTVIELAMRRFRYDELGQILKIDRAWSWRQDPGRALGPKIVKLKRLTDQDLVGQEIDDSAALDLLRSADLIIAHNAAFDFKFLHARMREVSELAWACTCHEIDWAAAGFDGRALGRLVAQSGYFYDGHRAENDVDAVLALLQYEMPDGRPALAELSERSVRPPDLQCIRFLEPKCLR